jgi:hypothetical protein
VIDPSNGSPNLSALEKYRFFVCSIDKNLAKSMYRQIFTSGFKGAGKEG